MIIVDNQFDNPPHLTILNNRSANLCKLSLCLKILFLPPRRDWQTRMLKICQNLALNKPFEINSSIATTFWCSITSFTFRLHRPFQWVVHTRPQIWQSEWLIDAQCYGRWRENSRCKPRRTWSRVRLDNTVHNNNVHDSKSDNRYWHIIQYTCRDMNGKKLGSDQNISSTGQIIASWAIINWLQVLYRLLWMTSAMIYDVTYNSSSKCVPLLTMFILFNSARIFFKYMSKRLKNMVIITVE